jgi:hypothetical protein
MYTSIPILYLREIIEDSLMNNLVDTQQIQEILKIYDLITSQNYLSHVDDILHQNDGLAMGAPSSAILSEVFLQYIEEIFITDILIQNKIIGYFHYVDDTLIIYDQTITNINKVLNEFNQIYQNLQYTMELEENGKINFLDLTISRTNQTIKFNIFQKPTFTDTIIPYNSCHPTEHKFASLTYLTNRVNTYQLNQKAKNNEIITIQNILHNNGFPLYYIDNFMVKQKQLKLKPTSTLNKDKKWFSFTFFGKETYHISKIFRQKGLQVTF